MSDDPDTNAGPKGNAPADGGFLSRWSRLKRTPNTVPEPAQQAAPPAAPAEPDTRPRDPETGEVIDEALVARLPTLDTLEAGGDLSAFMQKGVPEAMRRQALRATWTSDPMIRNFVSPALDYAHDYNTPGSVLGFGPLSESDIAQARDALGTIFSAPRNEASGMDHGQGEANRDIESHAGTDSVAVPVRRSDFAVQHESKDDVSSYINDLVPGAQKDAISPQISQLPILQCSIDEESGPCPTPPRRRRGGGAAPV